MHHSFGSLSRSNTRADGVNRGSLLQHLYDGRVNSFAFQMLVLTQRFAMLTTAIDRARVLGKEEGVDHVYVVAERSLIGDKLFAGSIW